MKRKIRLAYLLMAPITYQAPMLKQLAAHPEIELKVFYRSDFPLKSYHEAGLNQTITWDVPMLEGYTYEFLPTLGNPEKFSFFRPWNYGLFKKLATEKYDVLWIHGYTRYHELLGILFAKILGMKVLLRGESHAMAIAKRPYRKWISKIFFKTLNFICDGFLTIGTLNRQYLKAQGIQANKLFFAPYTVDNEYFQKQIDSTDIQALKQSLNIQTNKPVIMFISKLFPRKRPMDLLDAFTRLTDDPSTPPDAYLIFVGAGVLEKKLQAKAKQLGWDNILFLGFQNQSTIPSYYALADIFVLPSEQEPWGLVINEAMNAQALIITTDQVGSSYDLVKNNKNGFVYQAGNVEQLTKALASGLSVLKTSPSIKQASRQIIDTWSYRETVNGIVEACKTVTQSVSPLSLKNQ